MGVRSCVLVLCFGISYRHDESVMCSRPSTNVWAICHSSSAPLTGRTMGGQTPVPERSPACQAVERICWQARAKKRDMGLADLSVKPEYRVWATSIGKIRAKRRRGQCKVVKYDSRWLIRRPTDRLTRDAMGRGGTACRPSCLLVLPIANRLAPSSSSWAGWGQRHEIGKSAIRARRRANVR